MYIRIYKTTDSARFIQSINYTNRFYYIFANILSTKFVTDTLFLRFYGYM